ncbi:MAG TPA: glycerol-3-phosphate 1-O-acyltransferase PlsY [Tepidisphaeraceae bacterium]|nr:glycerol-3-phosphate 1-O-acyltransferase PlsY [Tepidisphaeraceae bacterium]
MTTAQLLLILAPIAYVAGSIPFGLLVGFSKGIDVRKSGSGNIGATNVGRLLGKKFFWIVFTLDLLKGMLPSLAAGWIAHFEVGDRSIVLLRLLVAFAAVLGHMFSIFLKFKGGKGVATSAGILLGIWPYYTLPALAGIVVFWTVYAIFRYISLASIVGAISFVILYVGFGLAMGWPIFAQQLPLLIGAILLASAIVVKHRGNIVRLLNGTEHKATHKPLA